MPSTVSLFSSVQSHKIHSNLLSAFYLVSYVLHEKKHSKSRHYWKKSLCVTNAEVWWLVTLCLTVMLLRWWNGGKSLSGKKVKASHQNNSHPGCHLAVVHVTQFGCCLVEMKLTWKQKMSQLLDIVHSMTTLQDPKLQPRYGSLLMKKLEKLW